MLSRLLPLVRGQRGVVDPRLYIGFVQKRLYSDKSKELSRAEPRGEVSTDVRPIGEKVKEAAKTVSYTGVIAVGVGITGIIFYYVFRELFSGSSPNSIYSAALDRCVNDPEIQYALGTPIKGYGEESSRRRRNRVSHVFYEREGVNCVRMQFYIQGSKSKATVQLDMKEVDGKFEYRYLLIQLHDVTRRVIVLEDNRAEIDKKSTIQEMQSLPSLM